MPEGSKENRNVFIQVIAKTFASNPSVNVVIGEGGNKMEKLSKLAHYSFIKAFNRGVALIFRSDVNGYDFKEFWAELKFALVIGFRQVIKALKRESFLKKHRYDGIHYYFWFFRVLKDGDRVAFELKKEIFSIAQKDKLPILLETSVWRNLSAYKRFGFEVYYEWQDQENGITVWFMKKDF